MTTEAPARGPSLGRGSRLLAAAASVLVAAFTVTTVPGVRSSTTFHDLYDG